MENQATCLTSTVYGASTRAATSITSSLLIARTRVAVLVGDLAEIDIEARHVPALTGNQHDAPARRLDRGLQADVGEVGDRQDIEHAPGVVGDVAPHLESDRLSHDAASSLAADHVAGVHGEALIAPGEPDTNRMAAFRRRVESLAADPVVRREPLRRSCA